MQRNAVAYLSFPLRDGCEIQKIIKGSLVTDAKKIKRAVFPMAGLGTRFLPATKSIPKEMLTLVDRPLIQYAIDEAREAGIEELIFVTSRGKTALEDYFDSAPELENALRQRGKTDLLAKLVKTNMGSGTIAHVRQHTALGLGHAVSCAARLIGDEPFAVILPDDVIAAKRSCLAQMIDAYQGGCMIAAMKVDREKTSSYGILDPSGPVRGRTFKVRGMVEKPSAGMAPSNYAIVGRYILTPGVMNALSSAKPGAGGEIQLTDAIASRLRGGEHVSGFMFDGKRYDCGSKQGLLQAAIGFALDDNEMRGHLIEAVMDATNGLGAFSQRVPAAE